MQRDVQPKIEASESDVKAEYEKLKGTEFTKAASVQPNDPEAWWYIGIRALQDGHKDAARSAWEKVLARIDPSQPEYKDLKTRLDSLGS